MFHIDPSRIEEEIGRTLILNPCILREIVMQVLNAGCDVDPLALKRSGTPAPAGLSRLTQGRTGSAELTSSM